MLDSAEPWGRFDDLTTGTAMRFSGVRTILVATRPDEVAPVLDEVERVTRGGRWAFGLLAYEAASGLNAELTTNAPAEGLPLAWFGVVDRPEHIPPLDVSGPKVPILDWSAGWDAKGHRQAVGRVRRHIAAGETYQCNLTTTLRAGIPSDLDPVALYRELAYGQRGAHNAYLDTGRFVVASASPELFFEQRGHRILMRPMKGTAARGRTATEDAAVVARLRGTEKERAENVMIVDLVRNDLGRIAAPGSVIVPRLLAAERYGTVYQLTSDVVANLRSDVGLTDVFRALFPCGSVTGAPKGRTMELIREIEAGPRGVYCGAIGMVGPPDAGTRARFSVAIRTVVMDRERQCMGFGTGGGITWSSEPAAEFAEAQAKARVLAVRHEEFHLVETLRHSARDGLRHVDAHLNRMATSALYFGFSFDPSAARIALESLRRKVDEARVRLRCHRDGTLGLDVAEAPVPLGRYVRLVVDPEPMDTTTCWSRHKTSLRAPYDERLDRHPAADDVVIVDESGQVTETCTANLAVRIDGRWWTPPLDSGCLPGIERAQWVADGLLRERTLRAEDLHRAESLAVLNSVHGWLVARLEAERLPPAGIRARVV